MIFLIPLLIVIAVIFGIDYLYFSDEDQKIEKKIPLQNDENLQKEREEYLKNLFKDKQ